MSSAGAFGEMAGELGNGVVFDLQITASANGRRNPRFYPIPFRIIGCFAP